MQTQSMLFNDSFDRYIEQLDNKMLEQVEAMANAEPMQTLNFSKGNAKLGKHTLIFSLPAGRTCPGAMYCKAFAVVGDNGKRTIQDTQHTQFRCFAASSEVQYDAVYSSRAENLQRVVDALSHSVDLCVHLLEKSIATHRTKHTQLVRIHESGDFFSLAYLQAWIKVAERNPDLKFYCYSKSLDLFFDVILPDNFYMTASYGGKHDRLIDEGFFTRYSKVFMYEEQAHDVGLDVDHDDSHCFGDKPFALLVHGTQPKGSIWGKAIITRRKNKQFSGYNSKQLVAA